MDIVIELEKVKGCLIGPRARSMIQDVQWHLLKERIENLEECCGNPAIDLAIRTAKTQLKALDASVAVGMLVERIHDIPEEDKADLLELNQALLATEDEEEIQSIASAFQEILSQKKAYVIPFPETIE